MVENMQAKKRPLVGIGVVVAQHGKVLLGKRKNAHGTGDWGFPGGHLEQGENIEDCALRELSEETGLKGISLKLGPWTNDVIEEGKHYITLFVFVDFFEGIVQLKEPHKCEAWEWFDWNDLPSPLFMPIRSLIKTMGLNRLKETAHPTSISLQNATYPLPSRNPHHSLFE